jgi:hypothetical protein
MLRSVVGGPQPAKDTWTTVAGAHAGKPLLARVDTAYGDPVTRGNRDLRIGVAIQYRKERPDGFPGSADAAALLAAEEEIVRLVGTRAVMVMVLTTDNMREFVLYTANGDWVAPFHRALATTTSPDVQVVASTDPEWSVYREFLRP